MDLELRGAPSRPSRGWPRDCAFEAICETRTFFQTSIESRPTLQRQHDHAACCTDE